MMLRIGAETMIGAKQDGYALSKKKICGPGFCGISSHDEVQRTVTVDWQRSKTAYQAFVAKFRSHESGARFPGSEVSGAGRSPSNRWVGNPLGSFG